MTKFLNKSSFKLSLTLVCLFFSQIVLGESDVDLVEIKLIDNLDDERGFCIDIKGYKLKAKINRGLQAHTCYSYQGEVAVDQGFDANRFKYKKLFFPNFNVCVSSTSSKKTLSLNLIKCINAQKFVIGEDNTIRLKNNINLCLTVAKGNSRKGGGGLPAHLIRNLTMQTCNHQISIYQTWGIRGFKKGKIFAKKISKSL